MKTYKTIKCAIIAVLLFLIFDTHLLAQIPTGIDAGQSDDAVSIYEQPQFIIPILTLFVVLIGFFVWRKRNKK